MSLQQSLEKTFGKEKILTIDEVPEVKVCSTGSISLDFATGVGGIPVGRVVEIYGAESVGKTALSYYMINEHLRAFPDKDAYFINIEGSFDPRWAKALAPNLDGRLKIASPDPGTESVHMIGEIVNSAEASIVVYDSVGAMLGDNERKPGEKKQAGGQSQLVTHMAKLVTVPADRNQTTVVILNQLRDTFNTSSAFATHAPGGRAIKHQAAMRILLKRGKEQFKAKMFGEEIEVGFRVNAYMKKNKASSPNMVASWNFYNRPLNFKGGTTVELDSNGTIGIDQKQEILDLAVNYGVIASPSQGYYVHEVFPEDKNGQRRIRGKDSVFAYLMEHPEYHEQLRTELMLLAQNIGEED